MNDEKLIESAKKAGIFVSEWNEESFNVRGNAYVRSLSCEVEWEEKDRESGEIRKYNSILSRLGWQWEKHWNVYTEEAPFGLMLSQLFDFLGSCIECNSNLPSYIQWGWDTKDFYLINIIPAGEHRWHRCLTNCFTLDNGYPGDVIRKSSENALKFISGWDESILMYNEPFFVELTGNYYLNCDLICAILSETGAGGRIANSPKIRFSIFRYIRSIPVFLRALKSRKELQFLDSRFSVFIEELKNYNSAGNDLYELLTQYLTYLLKYKIIIYSLQNYIPFGKVPGDSESILKKMENEFCEILRSKGKYLAEIKPAEEKERTFWEDNNSDIST